MRTPWMFFAVAGLALAGQASAQTVTQSAHAPATTAASTAATAALVRVDLSAGASQSLSLPRGKSAIIELPVDVRDLLVSNPGVADAVLRSPRRIYVLGMASGQTDAVFFDAAGRRILSLDIRVDQDTGAVAQTINRIVPGSRVRVDAMNDTLILSGQVASLSDADKAVQIARASVAKPEQVLNMLSITGKDQVMLKVRIVEMQRNVIKQLGVNFNAVLNQVGEPQYMIGNVPKFGINGAIMGGFTGGYDLNTTKQPKSTLVNPITGEATDIDVVDRNYPLSQITDTAGDPGLNKANAMIQAFERVGLVRTLAEPNLTAVSGESAKFLAGGEYPVPVGQDNDGRVTVTFKPFGVGLGFTPVVLSGGRIALRLSTEVSELTTAGAFSIGNGNGSAGLTIPALNVRRAETSVELPSGGSMMIAGLLQENTKQAIDSLPGMMNLPVLGALFRSRDYISGETELVVIVTPYLVSPTGAQNLQTPVDGLKIASDPETVLLGKLNKTMKTSTAAVAGRTYQGPFGYVIE